MKTRLFFSLAALLAANVVVAAPTEWRGQGDIRFDGASTLHTWSGTVPAEPFTAVVTMDDSGGPTAIKAKVLVKALKMDTREPRRDKDMRACMKVTDYPLIIGTIDTVFDKVMIPGEKSPSHLPFILSILGKNQQVDAIISNWTLKGDTAAFDLDFNLSLKSCGITVPSVLLVIRVADTIKLHANVKLVRS